MIMTQSALCLKSGLSDLVYFKKLKILRILMNFFCKNTAKELKQNCLWQCLYNENFYGKVKEAGYKKFILVYIQILL